MRITYYDLDELFARGFVAHFAAYYFSANVITWITLVLAVLGCFLILVDQTALGVFLYVLARFLDHVDGEVARIHNTASPFGQLFDLTVGAISVGLLYWVIGFTYELPLSFVVTAITIAVMVRYMEFASPDPLKPTYESNIIHHMGCHESGGLYYYLLPFFAVFGVMDWYVIISFTGHVIWTGYVVKISYDRLVE